MTGYGLGVHTPQSPGWTEVLRGVVDRSHLLSSHTRGFVTAFAGNVVHLPSLEGHVTMKLLWAGCLFGAGYALGRPEGRAELAELLQRPEVTSNT